MPSPQRYRSHDAPMPLRAATGRDAASKTLVATFPGAQYVAEREGSELRVYAVTDDGRLGTVVSDAAASHPSRLAALNRRFREIYGR